MEAGSVALLILLSSPSVGQRAPPVPGPPIPEGLHRFLVLFKDRLTADETYQAVAAVEALGARIVAWLSDSPGVVADMTAEAGATAKDTPGVDRVLQVDSELSEAS